MAPGAAAPGGEPNEQPDAAGPGAAAAGHPQPGPAGDGNGGGGAPASARTRSPGRSPSPRTGAPGGDAVLITAGCSWAGLRLADALLARGRRVVLFDQRPPLRVLHSGVTWCQVRGALQAQ